MRTYIIDISCDKVWIGCFDLKKQKLYASAEVNLDRNDDYVHEDGRIADITTVAVLINGVVKRNRFPAYAGSNGIIMFHTKYGSTKQAYEGDFSSKYEEINELTIKHGSVKLISDKNELNEKNYEAAEDIARLLNLNLIFAADYGQENTIPYSAEEAAEMFGGYKVSKDKKSDSILPFMIGLIVVCGVLVALLCIFQKPINKFLNGETPLLKEPLIRELPEEIDAEDVTEDFDVTLSGMNDTTKRNGQNAFSYYYLYLTDRNGKTLQWEVSADTYALIDYRYDVGDTITVTKHSKGYYRYKIGNCELERSKEVPE